MGHVTSAGQHASVAGYLRAHPLSLYTSPFPLSDSVECSLLSCLLQSSKLKSKDNAWEGKAGSVPSRN